MRQGGVVVASDEEPLLDVVFVVEQLNDPSGGRHLGAPAFHFLNGTQGVHAGPGEMANRVENGVILFLDRTGSARSTTGEGVFLLVLALVFLLPIVAGGLWPMTRRCYREVRQRERFSI